VKVVGFVSAVDKWFDVTYHNDEHTNKQVQTEKTRQSKKTSQFEHVYLHYQTPKLIKCYIIAP